MCGRFSLTTEEDKIERLFNVSVDRRMYVPRYNGAPTQKMAVITDKDPGILSFLRWGLVPFWAKDPSVGARMINARSESILEKPSFRNAFRKRRCLVLADSFFEWKKSGKQKIPYRIMMEDENPFAMAGIWEEWKDAEDRPLHTFSIITTGANELMKGIHHRMPAILNPDIREDYLRADPEHALEMLRPFDPSPMKAYTISTRVNKAVNDDPSILEAVDYEAEGLF